MENELAKNSSLIWKIMLFELVIFLSPFAVLFINPDLPEDTLFKLLYSVMILAFLDFMLMSSKWQATLGQRITGIYVTNKQGTKLSFISSLISCLPLSFCILPNLCFWLGHSVSDILNLEKGGALIGMVLLFLFGTGMIILMSIFSQKRRYFIGRK